MDRLDKTLTERREILTEHMTPIENRILLSDLKTITKKSDLKHLINFTLLIIVAITGIYSLIQFSEKWLLSVWLLVSSFAIVLLTIVGIVDVLHRISSNLIRDSIVPFRMFFTSPLPFLILIFLKRNVKENLNN